MQTMTARATALTRRLLAVLLLACGGVVLLGAPALACPQPAHVSLARQVEDADAVFTGTVADRTRQGPGIHYTVQVERTYKGDVGEQTTVMTPRSPRACGLPDLVEGSDYVFLATENGGDLAISAAGGTTRATGAHVGAVERLLGAGTSPTPPVTPHATLTLVAGEPVSRDRVAAPGVALVIVGLLGLVLVVSLGRRRSQG